MFAITGITGQVGGIVGQTLLDDGQRVRAVVRDAAKGAAWAARGCEVALASMADAAALTRAFTGAQGVFVLLPPIFDPAPGFTEARAAIAALRSAVDAARPGRVVCLSTIGAQATTENLLTQLGMLEQALSTLPVPVTFLRPAWFMENAAWDVAPARDTGVIQTFLQPLDRAIPMVATRDVGRTAAKLVQQNWTGHQCAGHGSTRHRIVELEGPRPVSPNDLAASFARALGRPVVAKSVPRDQWDARFREQGMRNPLPRTRMLEGFNEGWIAFESMNPQQGAESLDQVIARLIACSPSASQ